MTRWLVVLFFTFFCVKGVAAPDSKLWQFWNVSEECNQQVVDHSKWQQVLDVNLTSSMRLCRAVMRPMMKARWGRIINISSVVGATGNPGQVNYAASKAGMVGMTKSIAYEVASRGITANAVAPGFIATAMTDKLTDDQKEKINGQIPSGRMGAPEEIAAAVLYLASNEAGYVTGTTLHVNGGMAML